LSNCVSLMDVGSLRCGSETRIELLALDQVLDLIKVSNELVVLAGAEDLNTRAIPSSTPSRQEDISIVCACAQAACYARARTQERVASLASNVPELRSNVLVGGIATVNVLNVQLLGLCECTQQQQRSFVR